MPPAAALCIVTLCEESNSKPPVPPRKTDSVALVNKRASFLLVPPIRKSGCLKTELVSVTTALVGADGVPPTVNCVRACSLSASIVPLTLKLPPTYSFPVTCRFPVILVLALILTGASVTPVSSPQVPPLYFTVSPLLVAVKASPSFNKSCLASKLPATNSTAVVLPAVSTVNKASAALIPPLIVAPPFLTYRA